jgi:hypothetical protein
VHYGLPGYDKQLVSIKYAQRVVLHAPPWDSSKLVAFVERVERCIQDRVVLVCVIGPDCRRVEDVIDELVVGLGENPSRFINTTSHPSEPIDEVLSFAEAWTLDVDTTLPVQVVTL